MDDSKGCKIVLDMTQYNEMMQKLESVDDRIRDRDEHTHFSAKEIILALSSIGISSMLFGLTGSTGIHNQFCIIGWIFVVLAMLMLSDEQKKLKRSRSSGKD